VKAAAYTKNLVLSELSLPWYIVTLHKQNSNFVKQYALFDNAITCYNYICQWLINAWGNISGMTLTEEHLTTWTETYPSATLSTTNPTCTACQQSDRLVTNRLSHGPNYPHHKLGNRHCFGYIRTTWSPSVYTDYTISIWINKINVPADKNLSCWL
jgi:hypothetical protein